MNSSSSLTANVLPRSQQGEAVYGAMPSQIAMISGKTERFLALTNHKYRIYLKTQANLSRLQASCMGKA